MDQYLEARNARRDAWEDLTKVYEQKVGVLESVWKSLEKAHDQIQLQKDRLSQRNGGSNVSDRDILDINAGGQIVHVTRGTLTQIKGTHLEALFSGRWEKHLLRDSSGRIFLDVNPVCCWRTR